MVDEALQRWKEGAMASARALPTSFVVVATAIILLAAGAGVLAAVVLPRLDPGPAIGTSGPDDLEGTSATTRSRDAAETIGSRATVEPSTTWTVAREMT